MCVLLEELIEDVECGRGERGPPLPLLGGLAADELGECVRPALVPLFCLLHPAFEHGLDLLRTAWGDVQLLEPVRTERGLVFSKCSVLI